MYTEDNEAEWEEDTVAEKVTEWKDNWIKMHTDEMQEDALDEKNTEVKKEIGEEISEALQDLINDAMDSDPEFMWDDEDTWQTNVTTALTMVKKRQHKRQRRS